MFCIINMLLVIIIYTFKYRYKLSLWDREFVICFDRGSVIAESDVMAAARNNQQVVLSSMLLVSYQWT